MSHSDSPTMVTVSIRTDDPTAEIFILDSSLQLVKRGVGLLQGSLPPGPYKIKIRVGQDVKEELVILSGASVDRYYQSLRFSSAVPIVDTATSHEYHMSAAAQGSSAVLRTAGHGSSIFLLSRFWTPPSGEKLRKAANPAAGIQLLRADTQPLVDFGHEAIVDQQDDPSARFRVDVDPGFYILQIERSDGQKLQQSLIASPGWQTQFYLMRRPYETSRQRSDRQEPDMISSAVFMGRLGTNLFDPNNRDLRITETARIALINQRRVLPSDLKRMLSEKFENPILGIYGGYLMLHDPETDSSLYSMLISNMRRILDHPHPDVEALALACGIDSNHVFERPPMLRESWRAVVKATTSIPDLIPAGSFADSISIRLVEADPWLLWSAEADADDESIIGESIRRTIQSKPPVQTNPRDMTDKLVQLSGLPFRRVAAFTKDFMPFKPE